MPEKHKQFSRQIYANCFLWSHTTQRSKNTGAKRVSITARLLLALFRERGTKRRDHSTLPAPRQVFLDLTPKHQPLVIEGNDKLVLLFCRNASSHVTYRDHCKEL